MWGAVELDVGYRLPHETKQGDGYQANCGEKAGILYGLAKRLDVDNLQFYLRRTSPDRPEITHAFITFEAEGTTWIADPVEDVTDDFEIKKDAIIMDGERYAHYGLTRLSEEKLNRFIRRLRKPGSIIELFEGKQLLVDAKDENEEDIYAVLYTEGHQQLKGYHGPVLDVTIVYDEPFHTNSVIQLLYPVFSSHEQPAVINLFDSNKSDWFNFNGIHVGAIVHPESHDEIRVFRSIEDSFDDKAVQGILAYNEYMRLFQQKQARLKREKDPEEIYVARSGRREIVVRLQKRREELSRRGDSRKRVPKLAEEEQKWLSYMQKHTRQYVDRYLDFCVASYWRYQRKPRDALLQPLKTTPWWDTRIMEEYAEQKHLRRLAQTIERHGDKIRMVLDKIRSAYLRR